MVNQYTDAKKACKYAERVYFKRELEKKVDPASDRENDADRIRTDRMARTQEALAEAEERIEAAELVHLKDSTA